MGGHILTGPIIVSVPSSLDHLSLVQTAAGHAMELAGLGPVEVQDAQLALEEAYVNAHRHAFDPGEEGRVEVELIPTAAGVDIAVRNLGRPFDPESLPAWDPARLRDDPEARGLGVFLMRQMADRVLFLNQGRRGMEIRLSKYRAHAPVHEGEPAHSEEPEILAAQARDPGSFQVRPMAPGEAGAVSRCAWNSYRYSYLNEHIYVPERVREMNASGAMRSVVAIAEDGTLFGHVALLPCEFDPGLAEVAVGFVDPAYRGGGALQRLIEATIAMGRAAGLHGLIAHAVTTHPYSQRALHRFGFVDSCLFLAGLVPLRFKAIREGEAARESYVFSFLPLEPSPRLRIHPGPRHEAMVGRIYQELGREVELGEPAPPSGGATAFDVHVTNCAAANVVVTSLGVDLPLRLRRLVHDIVMDRLEVAFLYLPLSDPATGHLVPALEDMGFLFGGVHPGSPGKEWLVLQYLIAHPGAPETLQFDSRLAADLSAYIHASRR